MKILKITIKNARFVDHNGVNVEIYTPTYLEGNGWKCNIFDDGNLSCVLERIHDGIKSTLKLNIKNGDMKLLLKVGYSRPRVLRLCKLKNAEINGVVELPDDIKDMRKTHFREL